ncbi:MAG: hypothetical protein WCY37_06055 [Candidatus Dojkabacteria bacterium]
MEKDNESKPFNIPINWSSERDVTPRFANQAMINHTDDIFTLMFFDLQLPVFLGNEDEIAAQINNLEGIKPICVAKLYLPPSVMPSLISAIQQNFSKYQETITESKQEKE